MKKMSLCSALSLLFAVAAIYPAAASHRIELYNDTAMKATQEKWPNVIETLNANPRGMRNAGERQLMKAGATRRYHSRVWTDQLTPRQIAASVIYTSPDDVWSRGLTQIGNRMEDAAEMTGFHLLLRKEGRLPYRLSFHPEQASSPNVSTDTKREIYAATGDRRENIENSNTWLWQRGVGDGGQGDSVTAPCLGDDLPALPGLEKVKEEKESCPPWMKGEPENEPGNAVGAALVAALKQGQRIVGTHGVGSGAYKMFAVLLDKVIEENPDLELEDVREMRHALDHNTMVGKDPEVIEILKKYNMQVGVQVTRSLVDETPGIEAIYGPEGFEFQAPIRTLLDAGVNVSLDENEANFPGIEVAVTRRNPKTGEVQGPQERIDRVQALKMATIKNAEYNLAEALTGSLEVGKLADFIVIDKPFLDPVAVPDEQLGELQPLMTVIGGEVVWTFKDAPENFKAQPHFAWNDAFWFPEGVEGVSKPGVEGRGTGPKGLRGEASSNSEFVNPDELGD